MQTESSTSEVKFLEYRCAVDFLTYREGGVAICLVGAPGTEYEGEPIATASVYVGPLNPGEVAIKDYSENEGMLDALRQAGIVSAPVRYVFSGYVRIPICKLLGEGEQA